MFSAKCGRKSDQVFVSARRERLVPDAHLTLFLLVVMNPHDGPQHAGGDEPEHVEPSRKRRHIL